MTSRAPVAPVGCPIAIEPPLTLVFALIVAARSGSPSAMTRVDTSGTAANASLTSIRSICSTLSPTFSSAGGGAAGAAPELRELLQRRVGARRLVLADDERLSSLGSHLDRHHLVVELA